MANFGSRLVLVHWAVIAIAVLQPSAPGLPESCYLFSYFVGNGEDGLHLAWSRDALSWEDLNNGRSYLVPEVGESKLMRDPCLLRGPDGVFHLVWTTSWNGKTIGHASSRNLLEWSEQSALPVMSHEPDAQNCWAPEIVYDAQKQHFLIFWSTTILGRFPETALSGSRSDRNHRIYSTTTRDFKSFTATRLHYDGGFNVIDATMIPGAGGWLMFVKDETEKPEPQKNIRLVRAPTPDGPFSEPSPPITGDYWAEGPSAVRIGDGLYVFFDKYRERKYGCVRSTDLKNWEDISVRVSFPEAARHGTVIAVGRDILGPLLRRR